MQDIQSPEMNGDDLTNQPRKGTKTEASFTKGEPLLQYYTLQAVVLWSNEFARDHH